MQKITKVLKKLLDKKTGTIEKIWDFNSKAVLLSSSVIDDIDGDSKPEIIFGTKEGKVYCLNNKSEIIWMFDAKEEVDSMQEMFLDEETLNSVNSSPIITDLNGDGKKEVIFATELGVVYVLSSKGELIWKYKAEGPIRGLIDVADINEDHNFEIIFCSFDKHIYVLSNKGKELWKYNVQEEMESSPAIYMSKVPQIIFGTNSGKIVSVEFKGEKKWELQTDGKVVAQPTITNLKTLDKEDCIVVGSTDGTLYTLNNQGELLWKYASQGAIVSKANSIDVNKDGKKEIIFGSCDNKVHTVSEKGDKIWTYETDFWVVTTPLVADVDGDGKLEIVAGSYDHNLYFLDSNGSYMLDYVPGLSGIVPQAGHYSNVITQDPGQTVGKKIWEYNTKGIVVGCAYSEHDNKLVINTKKGMVDLVEHRD